MPFTFVFNAVKFLIIMESQRAVWMCGRMLGNQNRIVQQHAGFALLHHHYSDERQEERMERENSVTEQTDQRERNTKSANYPRGVA